MEFDFLPKLPKANLDDRTFKDLVDECILRIPRYCPEWTNYNPGDPGITLVELFAWLTDQMMVRFNQVPRRNFVTFLEILGIRLQPAAPAQTELTFYLTAEQPDLYHVAAGTEVATLRTETEEAIVFSTTQRLTIGKPEISHFLTSDFAEEVPQLLRDRLTHSWTQQPNGDWSGQEQFVFEEYPQTGNCFYLVFAPEQQIAGNVLALKLRGEAATSTGINPEQPPRAWQAWNGATWQSILLQEPDDSTRGFSFDTAGQQTTNPIQEADVVLHLPQDWAVANFSGYQGRWVRCVCTQSEEARSRYTRSPRLVGMSIRSIGGTINASQCTLIENEILGTSEGTPGQTFRLQSESIMPRTAKEHLQVMPLGGLVEDWQEVSDFSESRSHDRHYTIDSLTGEIQFGPLVRESAQLREEMQFRAQAQIGGVLTVEPENGQRECQYGAIPPKGAVLRMSAYRTGGGQSGNVQSGAIRVPKTAIPYIDRVINHIPARNGAEAESLDDAVMRVPRLLRTRDRAVTPEDFETLTLQAGRGAVARACCPPRSLKETTPGVVDLLVVPQANLSNLDRAEGLHPDQFALSAALETQIQQYLDQRRLLGVQVRLQAPEYVGVAVHAGVGLAPEYANDQARQAILRQLEISLYRFLNPLTGGIDGTGWAFGCPVYPSDIVSLFQRVPGVRYLGTILLFEVRRHNNTWVRSLAPNGIIDPGRLGLICSWADRQLGASHEVKAID